MTKKYVSRSAYMAYLAAYRPTVNLHTPCTFGHDESLIYG